MKFVFPIKDETGESLYKNNINGPGGFYPIGANRFWHGGMHFESNKPVVAIADGAIIAYRLNQQPLVLTYGGKSFKYSSSFALIRHEYISLKDNKLIFYSHYMHLLPASMFNPISLNIVKILTIEFLKSYWPFAASPAPASSRGSSARAPHPRK